MTLCLKNVVFPIDICTLHRISSKNVDLNMCAHTWHSVSVMGHKQGFELAVPVLYSVHVMEMCNGNKFAKNSLMPVEIINLFNRGQVFL